MEDFYNYKELTFENENLNSLINDLKQCFNQTQDNFCKLCFCVYSICSYFDNNYIGKEQKTNEYYDKNKLLGKFGFDKTAISRLTNCYLRFMTGTNINSVSLKNWYIGFSSSKLFELLKLSTLTLEDCIDKEFIRPDMTVKEIREYIKSLKDGTDKAEKVLKELKDSSEIEENEIPMAFNPKQHYEIDYFDSLSKKQLVNIAWEYQKYCEKLTSKKK